jgi:hypothetical protein
MRQRLASFRPELHLEGHRARSESVVWRLDVFLAKRLGQ